ncbi:glycosyltransferase family 4 protein [Clostridium perfringens]|uniref:glycosyltransferase family 4 protein n=1 Tax=Clostridium perfringens TaxID=1502 RepID=UPI00115BC691|nr:glycosyltransferase family 4 protein [Clostridium perfringens]ELP5183049.1 glycosyltransferase family 4 protein [Clostridium perfringens]ELP5185859.1 glycosyltransferase family 4 protein [Clostridium perfringens]ELP5188688.1 glycosyltransferase family 4 protein [Clostridium perfringens]MDK0939121.1 glycosyltransferase family 4 protein [Clostridium perfringens]
MVTINVLYINHENSLGGGTQSLLGIIDELKNKNMRIYVCIPNIGDGLLEKELICRKIEYIKLDYIWWMVPQNFNTIKKFLYGLKNEFKSINVIKKLAKFCEENNIDLIHSNSMVIDIGAKLSKITQISHVWHIREFGDDDHCLKFIKDSKRCFDFMNYNSEVIIAISKAIFNKFNGNFESNKMKLIYNGVKKIDLQKRYKDKPCVDILLAGAIKKNKGQEQAILAVGNLIKKGYNINLLLAGNIESDYGEYLKKIIKSNQIVNEVKFIGFTNELNNIRKNVDIELICSKKEAFGRVTVEAMMCGNAIIGANTGATVELIDDGYNGLLYRQGDIEDLAKKIESLISNREKMITIGMNGKKVAESQFTSQINANNIYNLYKKILNFK